MKIHRLLGYLVIALGLLTLPWTSFAILVGAAFSGSSSGLWYFWLIPAVCIPLGFLVGRALIKEKLWAFWLVFIAGLWGIILSSGLIDQYVDGEAPGSTLDVGGMSVVILEFFVYLLVFFFAYKSLVRSRAESQTGTVQPQPEDQSINTL